ncbi:16S rRNA (guanine(1207)-N(2))-methyltransferase RsmC [Motilimonas pumila]|uniref:Ribosomal RNA small subunit methyltransferase C n=1 Tax=Motilimonas pumila TaxID=2303987 RepID=A0A418YL20_9GAMM|nr:16S rRNA (guanine(1207)-N(2))-methyltransferase RsmC [Motilimonas pumila]RJG51510.1 16S rRNA (guanine(1207)-N(2))-methyltransferase RsmC [Motilimonas pumila]
MSAISNTALPPSQVVERNLAEFTDKHVLVAGAIEDTYCQQLAQHTASLQIFTTDYPSFQALQKLELKVQFEHQYNATSSDKVDAILLYLPKAKAEIAYLLANIMPHLKADGHLYIVGENRGGIKSVDKLLAGYGGKTVKIDSARRCSLLVQQLTQPVPEFTLENWLSEYDINIKGCALTVVSLPGVFSANELDVGTQLLLENIAPLKGNALDVGCGAGVIASFLLRQNDNLTLTLADVSALALESSRRTLAKNQLSADVIASDVFSNVTGRFNTIVSNPPFHAGLNTHYGAPETLIKQAREHLKIRGRLIIVANKFLRYEGLFEQAFSHCECLMETNKFKLISNYPD